MDNPLERVITWLWDRSGEKLSIQEERIQYTHGKIIRNLEVRNAIFAEVRRTQEFLASTKRG